MLPSVATKRNVSAQLEISVQSDQEDCKKDFLPIPEAFWTGLASGRGTRAVTQGPRLEGPQVLLHSRRPEIFTSMEHGPVVSLTLGLPNAGAGAVSGSYH